MQRVRDKRHNKREKSKGLIASPPSKKTLQRHDNNLQVKGMLENSISLQQKLTKKSTSRICTFICCCNFAHAF